jgi:signal transduction histidine kinase
MAGSTIGEPGRTLDRSGTEGLADLRRGLRRYTLLRVATTVVAAGAFMAGIAATSAALQGEADPGVQVSAPGSVVGAVSTTGFAWRQGVRPGQFVVALSATDDEGGWRLDTLDGDVRHVAAAAVANRGLSESAAQGMLAVLFGGAAVLLLGTRRTWVLPAAALAFVLASTPLALQGNPLLSTVGLGAAALLPAGWAIAHIPGGRLKDVGLIVPLCVLAFIWTATRLGGSGAYDTFESVRAHLASWGMVALVAHRAIAPPLTAESIHMIRPRGTDIAYLALIGGVALVLVNLLAVPLVTVAVGTIIGVAALPVLRGWVRPLRNAVIADVRLQAASEGAEAERARLAREIHDVPLQELMGIIRRLEFVRGAERERDDLQALAGHLRNVAMELRPPVLDDLGLPAALAYLSDETTTDDRPVTATIRDDTSLARPNRPPEDVELAMFRIAAEAVANALRHSGASAIRIDADVAASRIELEISDNGSGVAAGDMDMSARGSHMGLASMRRRAEAIDADLSMSGTAEGTTLRATWQA